jgi:hypothetical protein
MIINRKRQKSRVKKIFIIIEFEKTHNSEKNKTNVRNVEDIYKKSLEK